MNRIDWPAMSPDLSCIEHIWDVLGRAVSVRLQGNNTLQDLRQFLREEWVRNSTLQDLRQFLREEWARIPQKAISKLHYQRRMSVDRVMVAIYNTDIWITFLDNPCRD